MKNQQGINRNTNYFFKALKSCVISKVLSQVWKLPLFSKRLQKSSTAFEYEWVFKLWETVASSKGDWKNAEAAWASWCSQYIISPL